MNQKKIGLFIKNIRKKHNLTQKQFADKYGVTYQAVSKWENGLNMPDMSLIQQMSKDFGVSLEEIFQGSFNEKASKPKNIFVFCFLFVFFILLVMLAFFLRPKNGNFQFKTLSSNCDNFTISGSISYSESKSAIYITNIQYCGGNDNEYYKAIECVLYETDSIVDKKISSYKYEGDKEIKLEDFLQQVTLSVDNYEKTCKEYKNDSLYLSINATDKDGRVITYKIPLLLDKSCSVK